MKSIRSSFKFFKRKVATTSQGTEKIHPNGTAGASFLNSTTEGETPGTTYGTSAVAMTYNAVKVGMGLAKEVSAAFAPLEGIVRGLKFIMEHHEKWEENKEGIKRLIHRIEALKSAFMAEDGKLEVACRKKESYQRDVLLSKLQGIAISIDIIKNKHGISSYIDAAEDAIAISGMVEDIRDILMDYQIIAQVETDKRIVDLMAADDNRLLRELPRAPHASHLSETHSYCLRGTRKEVLNELEHWAEDTTSRPVFWLSGQAGSGKSTIAQSFCRHAYAVGQLGASYFCSRDYLDRSSLQLIFPTLAFQLACRFPAFRSCIVATLKQRPDIAQEALESQFRALIVEPFEETRISTIIAIDALDECKDAAPDSTILSLIAQYIHRILSVKFFIAGRPEPSIRNGFRLEPLDAITNIFVLYEIDEASVDSDIKLFLRAHLWAAVKRRSDFNLPSSTPWPSDEDVEILAAQCGQLFIYAATAVSFITSPADQPVERLALLKEIPKKNVGIDQLYTTILATGYSDSEKDDPEYMATWRRVMSGIVIALDPLTRQELAELIQLTPGKVASILRPLHAVLNVPTSADGPITFYHKSFADYISDGARCTDSRFQIVDGFPHIRFPLKSFFCKC